MMEETKVEIVLDRSRHATIFDYDSFFFQSELDKIINILSGLVISAPDNLPESDQHLHETIGIFGRRGVGKTSFMLSLENLLMNAPGNKINQKAEILINGLQFLPLMDPSKFEDTEYFLINIVSNICQFVNKQHSKAGKHSQYQMGQQWSGALDSWYKALKELSKTMISLHPATYSKYLEDKFRNPDIFAQDALMIGHSGQQAASKFHKFIDATIRVLRDGKPGLKTLVLMLDDVDTAFQKGWPVLETIRKYLTTPQLITIISGDLDLYEMIIRLNMIEKVDKFRLWTDGGFLPEQEKERLKKMERQYQLKILPVENRLFLSSSYDYFIVQGKAQLTQVIESSDKKKEGKALTELFKQFCEKIYFIPVNSYETDRILHPTNKITQIFPNSNRELIRLIQLAFLPCANEDVDFDPETRRKIIFDISGLFSSYCLDYEIDVDLLRQARDKNIEKLLFNTYIKAWRTGDIFKQLPEFYHFSPEYPSHTPNVVALTVQAALNDAYAQDTTRILDYWILLADFYLTCDKMTCLEKDSLNRYLSHAHYDMGQLPDIIARKISWEHDWGGKNNPIGSRIGEGYISVIKDNRHRYAQILSRDNHRNIGIYPWIEFLREKKINKEEVNMDKLLPLWSEFRESVDDFTKLLLDLFTVQIVDKKGTYVYTSFIRGLAVLGELLKDLKFYADFKKDKGPPNGGGAVLLINSWPIERLLFWQQPNRYYARIMETEDIIAKEPPLGLGPSSILILDFHTEFINLFTRWLSEYTPIEVPPIPVLGSIWRRFSNNIKNQADISFHQWSVGEMLRRSTLAFLNSILVEEIRWAGRKERRPDPKKQQPDYRYVGTSIDVLENNLKIFIDDGTHCYNFFTYWVLCPLLWFILPNEDREKLESHLIRKNENNTSIINHIKSRKNESLRSRFQEIDVDDAYTLFCALAPVPMVGQKKEPPEGREELRKEIFEPDVG